MGMYTGLRFKGYIKKEFRDTFENIALHGDWESSSDIRLASFGDNARASFIPCGILCYMPDEWEVNPYDYDSQATDGFDRTYNKETGYWTFQCSLKNYELEIEEFLNLMPYFIESVEWCEYYYEEWAYSSKYELIDNTMTCTDTKFIKYRDDIGYEY